MKISNFTLALGFFLLLNIFTQVDSQCCLTTVADSKKCASCPSGTHLYKGNCLINIDKCLKYINGFDCAQCEKGFQVKGDICTASSVKQYEDTYVEQTGNDNVLILADYTRSIHQQVATAKVMYGIIRDYKNGTQITIVHYETNDKKYFQAIGQFSKESAFIFELKDFKQLPSKPGKEELPKDNPDKQNEDKISDDNSNPNTPTEQNQFGISKINYKYLNFAERSNDEGFIACDKLIKELNQDVLGTKPIVLAAYAQLKGLSIQFFSYYQSTDKKSIFEARAVYQFYRKKVYILSFNKTYLK